VGLGALLAAGPGPARAWLPESHPIFGPPGRPASRPGALSVERAPPILVGVAAGEAVAVAGLDPARLGPYCGVPDALERTP
jgi:hypothetical protein